MPRTKTPVIKVGRCPFFEYCCRKPSATIVLSYSFAMRTHSFLNAAYFAVCSAEVLQITGRTAWDIGQTVQTTSGPVSGHAASNATEVSEYLGIPFAQPPVGNLRFAPPQKYSGTSPINGTNYVRPHHWFQELEIERKMLIFGLRVLRVQRR